MKKCIVYQRKPRWSDTDAAKIVYTGRIGDYIIESVDNFIEKSLGVDWFKLNIDIGIGTPFVSMKYDIFLSITPRDNLSCHVFLKNIGNSSVIFGVEIFNDNDICCVKAETVNVFVKTDSISKIRIPDDIRKSLEKFLI